MKGMESVERYVDLAFRLVGTTIPVDHGYALFSALSGMLPRACFHDSETAGSRKDGLGVHPIQGLYAGGEHLQLASRSRLMLRVPEGSIRDFLPLAGKRIDIEGCALRIGVCEVRALRPAVALHARFVTTRNAQDQPRFLEEIRRQMASLDVRGRDTVGRRRTMRIHGKQIVGYSVLIAELDAEESIRLQARGLGGRRKMGCGIFVPYREIE